jgi:hypothetical protein
MINLTRKLWLEMDLHMAVLIHLIRSGRREAGVAIDGSQWRCGTVHGHAHRHRKVFGRPAGSSHMSYHASLLFRFCIFLMEAVSMADRAQAQHRSWNLLHASTRICMGHNFR